MSREINIGYRVGDDGEHIDIDVRAPYFLFGTQQTSKDFWSISIWNEIGVAHLSQLGSTDPIYFEGWEMMAELAGEIRLFQDCLARIDFRIDEKSWFLAHLVYCYSLLVSTAPANSIPILTIG